MLDNIRGIIKKNGLIIALYFILAAVILISVTSIFFRNQIVDNTKRKETILTALRGMENMNRFVNLVDLGFRGYFIIPEEKFLSPYTDAFNNYQDNLDNLRSALGELGYDVSKMNKAERAIQEYMLLVQDMVYKCQIGDFDGAKELFKSDPGYDAWMIYSAFERDATEFVNSVSIKTSDNYEFTTWSMVIFQGVFVLIGIPVLILTIISLRTAQRHRKDLYKQLSESDRKYIFNPGDENTDSIDESGIIRQIIDNLKRTTEFIKNITQGNYEIQWPGLNEKNANLNQENIAGELITMRDQMKKVKSEDEKRIWISQGLSDFATIIRKNQNNFKTLSEELITSIVKYLNVQMGGLFIVNHDNENETFLELTGCYAYNRLKTMEKKISPGKGLVGQCYLEGETIYLKQVPQEYVNITSGLGDTRPDFVLIIPLRLNNQIEGVIELASLHDFADHEIEFLEKLGETLASAITTVRTTERTNILLEQTQQQAEEMRAQEEEMRQNMEELEATQEEMQRQKDELEMEKSLMDAMMQNVPEYIYFKDRDSKFLRTSTSLAKSFGLSDAKTLVGKSDFDFFADDHARPAYESEQEIIKTGKPFYDLVEKEVKKDGTVSYVSTSKMPMLNKEGEIIGTFGISKDITEMKQMEFEMQAQNEELRAQEEEMRQNMEELHATQEEMQRQKDELEMEKSLMDAMMQNIPEYIYFKDKDSKFLRTSTSLAKSFGMSDDKSLIGKSDFDFFADDHARPAYESEQEIIKTGKPFYDLVEKEVKKDGTVSYVSTSKMPLLNKEGSIIGTFGISKDITEMKVMENELKEQNAVIVKEKEDLQAEQAILKTLMELLPERITIKDDHGKYLNLSEAKYKTLREQGYKNLIGKSDKEIFGAEHFKKSFGIEKQLMKSKQPVLNIEEKIQVSKDKSIWGLTSRAPFINSNGDVLGTIVITQDISAVKECQQELDKLKKKAS